MQVLKPSDVRAARPRLYALPDLDAPRLATRPAVRALAIYVVSRLVVLAAVAPTLLLGRDPGKGPWPFEPAGAPLLRLFGRWDAAWYVMIARRGYPNPAWLRHHLSDVAFFPLHPLLLRLTVDATGLSPLVAGVALVTALGALAAVLMWRLADALGGTVVADRATALVFLFPGAFCLSFIYAEPVMMVGLVGCLLALVRRRWVLAGLCGAVATASRPNACVIIIACAWAAWEAVRRRREWAALAAPVLAAAGVGAFVLYLWVHTGDATAWFRSERVMWHDHVSPTAVGHHFLKLLHHLPSLRSSGLNYLILNLGLVFVVGSLLLLRRSRLPGPVTLYTVAALLLPLTSVAVGPRPRMLLAAFPVAIAAAVRMSRRGFAVAAGLSAAGLACLSLLAATSLAATP
ncbi:MAG TPA: hypothetical protein VFH45_03865 [Acidimicrobiales bacterium]|nr:hypothetical protein [Acidimicrobiales bacterium]